MVGFDLILLAPTSPSSASKRNDTFTSKIPKPPILVQTSDEAILAELG